MKDYNYLEEMPKIDSANSQAFKLILAHWNSYEGDKFLIYNPYEKKFIFGNDETDELANAPYLFYPLTFFTSPDGVVCAKAFKQYLVIQSGEIIYNSFSGSPSEVFLSKIKHSLLRHGDSYDDWQSLFQVIQKNITAGEFEKVVVARKIEFTCAAGYDITSILLNLFENNFNSYIFAYQQKGGIFFGASPELLVEKKAGEVKSFSLAGTMKKSTSLLDEQKIKFLSDAKNIYEHKIVTKSIAESFKKLGQNIVVGESSVLELKNLLHLKTEIKAQDENGEGTGRNQITTVNSTYLPSPKGRILDWVAELHPTPALGGSPKEAALKFIKEHEKFDRGHYGAPFGVVDAKGDGFFIVAIRSGLIRGNVLSAYAGCGIVAQSDCAEDFAEIDHKLRTIIEAL